MSPEPTLLPGRLLFAPLAVALAVEPVALAMLAAEPPIGPGWYGRSGLLVATHLVTIGALALPITGAGWQLLAVLGTRAPSSRASRAAGAVTAAAVLAAPVTWWGLSGRFGPAAAGAAALMTALAARSAWALTAIAAAPGRREVRVWLAASELSLLAGLGYAAALYATRAGWPLITDPIAGVGRHAAFLLAGWVGGQIVGWSALLVPMFGLTREPPPVLWWGALALWYGGLLAGAPAVWGAGAVAVAAAVAVMAAGRRRADDAAMRGVFTAFGALSAVGALALAGAPAPLLVAALLLGWALPTRQAMALSIVPFLAWAHAVGGVGAGPAPASLVPSRLAAVSVAAGVAGALTALVGVAAEAAAVARLGFLGLFVASLGHAATCGVVAFRAALARLRRGGLAGMEAR